jgi:hypothetical protein
MPAAGARAKLAGMSVAALSPVPRVACLCGALALAALAAAGPARAQGISLGWQDCRAGGNPGFNAQNYGCGSNLIQFPMFPGVRLLAAVDSVFSSELVIDVDVASDPMPAWWSMDGSCRPLSWSAGALQPGSCSDPWNGLGAATVQGWLPGSPGNSNRHARMLVAAGVLSEDAVKFDADVPYTLCRIVLDTRNTTVCPTGCTTSACLVFNSVLLRRLPGSTVEEVFVSTPEVAGNNIVMWQPGLGGANCASVPVRRSTWGAVKALYR